MCILLLCMLAFQEPSEIREQVDVAYRQIQVRVQDRDGKPIRQLGPADFVLLVNDKTTVPRSFLEIGTGAESVEPAAASSESAAVGDAADADVVSSPDGPAEVAQQRSVAILIDPGMSSLKGFQVMQKSALELIDGLPAGTRVAVYQMHLSLRTLSLLTHDRELLRRQIEGATYYADLWSKLESFQKSINREVAEFITLPLHGNNSNMGMNNLSSLGGLLQLKAQVKDSHANKLASSLDTIGRVLVPLQGERSIFMLTAGGYSDDHNLAALQYVCAQLNWENIPIHALHFRDMDSESLNLMHMGHMTEVDLRNVQETMMRNGFIESARSINTLDENEENLKTAPRIWAQETGGSYATSFNPLQVAEKLQRLEQGANHYYLISYPTTSALDKVEVQLAAAREGWDLRFGRMRGKVSTVLGATRSEKATDFASTLMYGFPHRDTEVEWAFQRFRLTDGTFVFPVLGQLSGSFPDGGYELGLVALDEHGAVLDERKSEIRKPGPEQVLEFYDLLATRARPVLVRALIREKKSGKTSLEEWALDERELNATGLSSLVLVPSAPHEIFAIHALNRDQVKLDKKKVARERLDPLIKAGGKRIPMTFGPFAHGQPLGLYFHAQRLDGGLDQYDLEAELRQDDKVQRAPLKLAKVESLAPDGAELMAVLDTTSLQGGAYVLAMRLRDKRTGTLSAYSERPFTLDR